jgi:hypothetical protein
MRVHIIVINKVIVTKQMEIPMNIRRVNNNTEIYREQKKQPRSQEFCFSVQKTKNAYKGQTQCIEAPTQGGVWGGII